MHNMTIVGEAMQFISDGFPKEIATKVTFIKHIKKHDNHRKIPALHNAQQVSGL